jgi:hypothetical protein
MAVAPGLLIQPYVSVYFGGTNLNHYDAASSGEPERMCQKMSFTLSKDQKANECKFDIFANPDGFDLVTEIRASNFVTEPFVVRMGYPHLPEPYIEQQFNLASLDLTTGHDPNLSLTGVSAVKGAWSDNKVSFTMEEGIPLSEFPDFLKEKAGEGAADLKFEFVGQAKEDAPSKIIKKDVVNQSPQVILTEVCKEQGMELRVHDTSLDGTMIINYPAAKPGELEKDKPEEGGKSPVPAKRSVHILGPGLMENIKRRQAYSSPQQADTQGGTSNKETAATETEAKGSQIPGTPAGTAAASANAAGTTGPANKPKGRTGVEEDGAPDEKEKARLAMAQQLAVEMTADFIMVPQVVGMRPGDIVCVPSLKGPGDYIEDFEIKEISYTQEDTGFIRMGISAWRPYLGKKNMLDAGSVAMVQARVQSLTEADAWNQYYWRQGPQVAWPLAG